MDPSWRQTRHCPGVLNPAVKPINGKRKRGGSGTGVGGMVKYKIDSHFQKSGCAMCGKPVDEGGTCKLHFLTYVLYSRATDQQ